MTYCDPAGGSTVKRAPGATVVDVVVVVDGDDGERSIWRRCLDPPEFVVRPVGSEDEASAALRAAPADVLLLSLGISGISAEAIARLRNEQPGLEVVAMTAPETDLEETQRLVEAGVFGVLCTPIANEVAAALMVRTAAKHARLWRLMRRRDGPPVEALGPVVVAPELISHREW